MIGGNTSVQIQISTTTKNEIGESIKAWETVQELFGWLDLSGGDSKYQTYDAKIQESTHVFVADYSALDSRIKAENSRLLCEGKVYDITLIDDPMYLHQQWEIFLKFTGGQ
ncbi:MAG: head-tail adaptor protein [Bacteroidaceae bacterium]|nr:head-tail adaptor protein [Holdemanella sp.]MCF0185047.1 head-tail adaptor protein [Bacteroidaceae bacterium]